MVPRYSRPQMAAIWSPEERYRIWFEIEALAAEAMAGIGTIPAEAARAIRERGGPRAAGITAADVERIDEIERVTRHDVIAFLTWLGEGIGPEARISSRIRPASSACSCRSDRSIGASRRIPGRSGVTRRC